MRLTETGKTFLPRARAVPHDLESARSDMVEKKIRLAKRNLRFDRSEKKIGRCSLNVANLGR